MKPMKPIVKKVAFLLLGIAGLFALPGLVITAMTAIAEVSVGDREEIREYTANWGCRSARRHRPLTHRISPVPAGA